MPMNQRIEVALARSYLYNNMNEDVSGSYRSGSDASLLSGSKLDFLTKKTPSLSEIKVVSVRSYVDYDQSNACLYVA